MSVEMTQGARHGSQQFPVLSLLALLWALGEPGGPCRVMVEAAARPPASSVAISPGGDTIAAGRASAAVDGCQTALNDNRVEVTGSVAVLPLSLGPGGVDEALLERQVRSLHQCHWVGWQGGSDLAVTVTSEVKATKLALASLAQRHRIVILEASPWPGNLVKLVGYARFLRALVRVTGSTADDATRPIRVLLTDCCDVLFREDASCKGGGKGGDDIFERLTKLFTQKGQKVVFSAERGTSMLASKEDYTARLIAARAADLVQRVLPPKGWNVPVWRPLRNSSSKAAERERHFSHTAMELAPSPLLRGMGTPDICTGLDGLCLHAKSVNDGLIVGELETLASVYEEALHTCGAECNIDFRIPKPSSEQNVVVHYLILSHFCGGLCAIDYNFSIFHTLQGHGSYHWLPREAAGGGSGLGPPRLALRVPVARQGGRVATDQDVLASQEWIALSPEAFDEALVPVEACALHAAGLPEPQQVRAFEELRTGLGLQTHLLPFSLAQQAAGATNSHVTWTTGSAGETHVLGRGMRAAPAGEGGASSRMPQAAAIVRRVSA